MSKRIEWTGHLWRSNGIIKKVFEGKVDRKRFRGRPGQRWIDRVNDDLNKCSQGITLENSIGSQIEKCSRGSESPSRTVKAEEEDILYIIVI